ncbi:MAG: single-stranded DNA-binding protein [Candidatus Neomarinimicrobiota bacterium]
MALSKGSVNKVILVGHLGRDPEVRYTPNGDAVAEVSIATTESVKNRDGKREDRTEWHNLVIWRGQAEFAKEWLKKGQLVYVEGRLQTRQWEDKEGQKRSRTDIQVDQITMLGGSGRSREKDAAEPEVPATQPPDDEIPF